MHARSFAAVPQIRKVAKRAGGFETSSLCAQHIQMHNALQKHRRLQSRARSCCKGQRVDPKRTLAALPHSSNAFSTSARRQCTNTCSRIWQPTGAVPKPNAISLSRTALRTKAPQRSALCNGVVTRTPAGRRALVTQSSHSHAARPPHKTRLQKPCRNAGALHLTARVRLLVVPRRDLELCGAFEVQQPRDRATRGAHQLRRDCARQCLALQRAVHHLGLA